MRLENTFTVPCDPDAAWRLLLDVPAIAPCLPGAELTEVAGGNTYKGRARVKVGPVLLAFAGTAEIVEADNATRRARVRARGADEKGRGSAQAEVTFAVEPQDAGSRVNVVTDLNLVGAVAQYGRASGLIQSIAGEIVKDFAANLEAMLRESEPAPSQAPAAESRPESKAETKARPKPAAPIGGIGLFWRAIRSMIAGWWQAIWPRSGGSKT